MCYVPPMRKTSSSRAAYNEALGITVNQLLFEHRLTRKELAAHFGVTQPVVSRKLRGQVNWTAEELSIMAGLFGLSMDSFTPVRADDGWVPAARASGRWKTPARVGAGVSGMVAGEGFEPSTSGLRAGLVHLARGAVLALEHAELVLRHRLRGAA